MTAKLDKKPVSVEMRAFAKNIRLARLNAQKTQKEIEAETGLSRPYLSDVERLVSGVSIDSMGRMAQAVHVPLFFMLMPDFQSIYDFESTNTWDAYKKHINNADGIIYERRLFGENLKNLRLSQKLRKYQLEEMTGSNSELFAAIENHYANLSLDVAVKVAHALMTPLYMILKPQYVS